MISMFNILIMLKTVKWFGMFYIRTFTSFIAFVCVLIVIPSSLATTRGVHIISKQGQELYLYKDYYALVVGVGDYDYWPDLRGAVKDAGEIADMLKKNGMHVELLLNPTSSELKNSLDSFAYGIGSEKDRAILFFFSGHGETETLATGEKLGYMVLKDTPLPSQDRVGFINRAISMNQIESYALLIKSKHVLMVFDSCFSGSVFSSVKGIPKDITEKSNRPVRQFITAGNENEQVPDESVFKTCFIQGIQGEADANSDGYVTGSELGLYLDSSVVNYSKGCQHPQYGKIRHPKLDKGDFIFKVKQARTVHLIKSLPKKGRIFVETKPEIEISLVKAQPITKIRYEGKTISNSLGMKFIKIPKGTFLMGSPSGEPRRFKNEKQHSVDISRPFYLQTTEVTQGQWKEIMGNNPSYFKDCGDKCPVERVSWNECQEFIQKLNQKESINKYRLPTEAEWEYVCRAGSTTAFYAGNCISSSQTNYNSAYPMPGCKKEKYRGRTLKVGSFSPNPWGLYDMHGNVWEWCEDRCDWKEKTVSENNSFRVCRGGSWGSYAALCRSSARRSNKQNYKDSGLGFRLARTP
jgi:formylglycine-generating enzyme required for sulfatase activity